MEISREKSIQDAGIEMLKLKSRNRRRHEIFQVFK